MNRRRALAQLTAALGGRVPPSPDWPAILSLANEQLVTPELHARLSQSAERDLIPDGVAAFLADAHRRNRVRNLSLFATLTDALEILNAAGVEPVLLKGCAMWTAHADAVAGPCGDRMISDLDLLVRPSELDRAADALAAAGFTVLEDERRHEEHPVVVLGRATDAGSIDLHQFAPGPRGIAAIDDLHAQCRVVTLGGARALLPPPELQILIGVLHDQLLDGHLWRGQISFRHLMDVAALGAAREMDWARLMAQCSSPLVRHATAVQLLAAARIAGAPLPNVVSARPWARLHARLQRLQFIWPALNAPLHRLQFNKRVWRRLRSRRIEPDRSGGRA